MLTILHIVKKEFLQFFHSKRMFAMSIVAPTIQLLILGYAATFDVKDISMVVCDYDNTPSSRYLIENFVSTGYFTIVSHLERYDDINKWIDNGKAKLALVIPAGYERKIEANKTVEVQCIADGTETTSASLALSYAMLIITRVNQNIFVERFIRQHQNKIMVPMSAEMRIWYNPELKSRNFMVPGVIGLLLMLITTVLSSLAIVKEKEIGTLEQIIVTPIKSYQFIAGKLIPFFMIGMVDVFLVILFTTVVFNLPIKGSIPLLFLLCSIFLLTTLGLGLFISTISHTQQQAMMTAIFFFMLPMIYFSGFVFPIENMPKIFQFISVLMPLRYFFTIVRGIFLKGVGLSILWPQALALLVFGISIFSLSVIRFHKRLG